MTVADIAGTARTFLRDYPKFFEVELGPLNVLTVRLPHPLIAAASLQAYTGTEGATPETPWTAVPTDKWSLDDRNGLLKFTDPAVLNKRALVAAYYYTWFADSDLNVHAQQAANETVYNTSMDANDLEGAYADVTAMSAVVRALWSMALELSFDIDVSTPEGMYIPARQRFAQVMQMMQYWEGEYTQRANALNIGFGALEQFRLRRVAYMTGRYVPVYVDREIDDHRWPKRLYPPIPDGTLGPDTTEDDIIELTESGELRNYARGPYPAEIGWTSIGTRGDYP